MICLSSPRQKEVLKTNRLKQQSWTTMLCLSTWSCSRRVGLHDLQRFLPTPPILWFCDLPSFRHRVGMVFPTYCSQLSVIPVRPLIKLLLQWMFGMFYTGNIHSYRPPSVFLVWTFFFSLFFLSLVMKIPYAVVSAIPSNLTSCQYRLLHIDSTLLFSFALNFSGEYCNIGFQY